MKGVSPERRCSPPVCIGPEKKWVMGRPVKDLAFTSYVERSNLTLWLMSWVWISIFLLEAGRQDSYRSNPMLQTLRLA